MNEFTALNGWIKEERERVCERRQRYRSARGHNMKCVDLDTAEIHDRNVSISYEFQWELPTLFLHLILI